MKALNTFIRDEQDEWLRDNSVTRGQSISGKGKTKTEHVRAALKMYINSFEEEK